MASWNAGGHHRPGGHLKPAFPISGNALNRTSVSQHALPSQSNLEGMSQSMTGSADSATPHTAGLSARARRSSVDAAALRAYSATSGKGVIDGSLMLQTAHGARRASLPYDSPGISRAPTNARSVRSWATSKSNTKPSDHTTESIGLTPSGSYVGRWSQSTREGIASMTKSKADLGLNSFTLSFIDPEMQSEYEIYFVKRHLRIWIKNVAAICLGFSAAYAGFLSTAQSGSREWETRFSPSVKGTTNWSNIDSVCPPGWFCMECNPDHICGHYTISYDVAFWCIGVAVPFAGALAAMLFLNELTLARNVSFIFASFSAWLCVVAVEARYAIIAPKSAIYERGFFSILSISCTLTFLKVRFIDAIWSCFVVTVACAVSLIQNFSDGSNAGAVVTTKGAGMFVGAMAVISLVICWSCHESEFFIKQQFIASATLQRDNKKLVSQLKVLHRRFDDQAAELDSPLEKSVMLIKMLQADSALTADHLGVLSEVLKHLTSGNLLTPDLETQAPELLDSDQQAWLFTEIMPKQRRRSNIRRGDGPVFRAPETINEDPRSNSNSVTSSMVASERPPGRFAYPARRVSRTLPSERPPHGGLPNDVLTESEAREDDTALAEAPPKSSNNNISTAPPASSVPAKSILKSAVAELKASSSKGSQQSLRFEVARPGEDSLAATVIAGPKGGTLPRIVGRGETAVLPVVAQTLLRHSVSSSRSEENATGLKPVSATSSMSFDSPPPSPETCDFYHSVLQRPAAQNLLAQIHQYDWPVFELAAASEGRPLRILSTFLFEKGGLFSSLGVSFEKFWRFATAIEDGYHADLPYHTSTHASDVLHCMSYLAATESVSKTLSGFDLLSIYFAAMIHDFNHPGLNNNFLMNTLDPRAILYNDRSVLENHHLAASFEVLMRPECNFLSHLPQSDFKPIREAVIDMVLATDLSQHFSLITLFKTKVTQSFNPTESREDRLLLFKILMKISDVSNPTKEWSLYFRWSTLVLEEFMHQGDKERALGIPISPYMDRETLNVPSSQIGFIDFVIAPLFDAFEKFEPIPGLLANLRRNKEHWVFLKNAGIVHLKDVVPPSDAAVPRSSDREREREKDRTVVAASNFTGGQGGGGGGGGGGGVSTPKNTNAQSMSLRNLIVNPAFKGNH